MGSSPIAGKEKRERLAELLSFFLDKMGLEAERRRESMSANRQDVGLGTKPAGREGAGSS